MKKLYVQAISLAITPTILLLSIDFYLNHKRKMNVYEQETRYEIRKELSKQLYQRRDISECLQGNKDNQFCKEELNRHLIYIKSLLSTYNKIDKNNNTKGALNPIYKNILLNRLEVYREFGVDDTDPKLKDLFTT